jgi:hypothetical protein
MKTVLGAIMIMTAGCAQVPPADAAEEENPAEHGSGTCDASKGQSLIGRTRSGALGEEAKRLTGATALRWIPPGAMVTMDYREDRVNLELDARNKVTVVRCG